MLGKILTINKNSAIVAINKANGAQITDLINLHVVFEDQNKKILGEIDSIEQDTIKITFLGELTSNDFIGGLIKKPSLDAKIRIINPEELKILTGVENRSIRLGVSPLYNDFPLNVSIDELLDNDIKGVIETKVNEIDINIVKNNNLLKILFVIIIVIIAITIAFVLSKFLF